MSINTIWYHNWIRPYNLTPLVYFRLTKVLPNSVWKGERTGEWGFFFFSTYCSDTSLIRFFDSIWFLDSALAFYYFFLVLSEYRISWIIQLLAFWTKSQLTPTIESKRARTNVLVIPVLARCLDQNFIFHGSWYLYRKL